MEKLKTIIGPKAKGFSPKTLKPPKEDKSEQHDFSRLPKFLSYQASFRRERQLLKLFLVVSTASLSTLYLASRLEISDLHKQLRLKEYILAPGVVDFTPAAPQTIPDSYVKDAVNDFVANLGNVNVSTIDEQYGLVKRFMSDKLKIEFELDTNEWKEQVKKENISQLLTVKSRTIKSDDKGNFKATITGRAEFYASESYLGHEDQVIEMNLKLMPPTSGKRWYLQIEKLNWNREATYKTKKRIAN